MSPSPSKSLTQEPEGATFVSDLKDVAHALRSSLATLMSSAGVDPNDPKALSIRWGIKRNLSWKVSKIVQSDDPIFALQQLPGKEGIEILLEKGRAAGLPESDLDATQKAVQQFDRLIEKHCGDRATFDIMGTDISPAGHQQHVETHRKQLFEGASCVWGVQTKLALNLRFLAPGASQGTADIAKVVGLLGFRRLRENTRWVLSKGIHYRDDGSALSIPDPDNESLDPASADLPVPLMPEFCSQPIPKLNSVRDGQTSLIELEPGQVGNTGEISYVTGNIERGFPNVSSPQDKFGSLGTITNTPAELLIFDLYIHKSFPEAMPPKPMLTSLLGPSGDHERYQLPLYESLIELGPAFPAPATLEMPRYPDLLRAVFQRTGWSPTEFRGFRIKMAYPPLFTALLLRYPLPAPSDQA
jgi:hypothetical protein